MNPNGNGGLFRGLIEEGMVREPGRSRGSRSPDRWAPAAGGHGDVMEKHNYHIWKIYGYSMDTLWVMWMIYR